MTFLTDKPNLLLPVALPRAAGNRGPQPTAGSCLTFKGSRRPASPSLLCAFSPIRAAMDNLFF
jgi:hypothetical protein